MKGHALLLLVGVASCWVPTERGHLMEGRIERLEDERALQVKELEEQRALIRGRIVALGAELARVQQKIDEIHAATRRSDSELASSQDQLEKEIEQQRDLLKAQVQQLDAVNQASTEFREDTQARFAALQGQEALDEFEARREVDEMQLPSDKEEFLALARAKEQSGDLALARVLYARFATRWPSDPETAHAHFRSAEILFGQRRYREAILEYKAVAQDFPRSDLAPDALLRSGESLLALDLRADAGTLFEQVLDRYPSSTAAEAARARLEELGLRKPPGKPAERRSPSPR